MSEENEPKNAPENAPENVPENEPEVNPIKENEPHAAVKYANDGKKLSDERKKRKIAEDKAAKLEAENNTLNKTLEGFQKIVKKATTTKVEDPENPKKKKTVDQAIYDTFGLDLIQPFEPEKEEPHEQ